MKSESDFKEFSLNINGSKIMYIYVDHINKVDKGGGEKLILNMNLNKYLNIILNMKQSMNMKKNLNLLLFNSKTCY